MNYLKKQNKTHPFLSAAIIKNSKILLQTMRKNRSQDKTKVQITIHRRKTIKRSRSSKNSLPKIKPAKTDRVKANHSKTIKTHRKPLLKRNRAILPPPKQKKKTETRKRILTNNSKKHRRILKKAIKPVLKKTVKISNSRLRPLLGERTKPRAEILQETIITEQKGNKRNSPSIWSGLNRETKMSNMTVRQS